jgi:hypothetical protein
MVQIVAVVVFGLFSNLVQRLSSFSVGRCN